MIRFTSGNLLESGTDAVVNTVNTVGVMGKGIALMFKEAFPSNFASNICSTASTGVISARRFVSPTRSERT
jgi:O-acetyl-ADP-ribose deacetylase (regulator of RNase III)